MVWAKIDDEILDNPKIIAIGPIGFALYVGAITWCARNLTDGFIPKQKLKHLLGQDWTEDRDDGKTVVWTLSAHSNYCGRDGDELIDQIVDLMVSVGVMHEDFDERSNFGYRLHDYDQYNPTRAEVLEERERKRTAGKLGGSRSASKRKAEQQAPAQAPAAPPAQAPAQAEAKQAGKQNGKQKPTPVPDPDPVPEEEDLKSQPLSKDLSGSADPPAQPASGLVSCPANLWEQVPEDTRAALEFERIPRWSQEIHCREFASRNAHRIDRARPVTRWISTWQAAIRTDWTDPSKRPQKPAEPKPDRSAKLQAQHDAKVAKLNAEVREAKARGELPDIDPKNITQGIG